MKYALMTILMFAMGAAMGATMAPVTQASPVIRVAEQAVPDSVRDAGTPRPPQLPGRIEQVKPSEQADPDKQSNPDDESTPEDESIPINTMGQMSDIVTEKEPSARESYIRGLFHLDNKAYNDALDDLLAAHTLLPEEPAFNHALSDAYRGLGDSMNAQYYAKIAVTLDPSNIWYHQTLAKIYEEEGRPEAVLDTYRNALDIHPNHPILLDQLAEAYMQFGQLLRANEIYDQILAQRGSSSQIHMNKYWNFRALGRTEDALAELQAIRANEPGNLPNLRLLASNYMEIGRMDDAFAILTELKNRNARDIQTMLMLVEFHLFEEDWVAVERAAETLLTDPFFYPSDKLQLMQFILSFLDDGISDDGASNEGTANEVITSDDAANDDTASDGNPSDLHSRARTLVQLFANEEPAYGPAQDLLSQFYRATGAETDALRQLIRINRMMPDNEDAWRDRLQILFLEGRFADLISVADTALTHHPEHAEILYLSGAAHLHQNQPEQAIPRLEEASFSPAPRTLRAAIHIALGDALLEQEMQEANLLQQAEIHNQPQWTAAMLREAERNYERALRLEDGNPDALGSLAYLKALETTPGSHQTEPLQEALNYWQQALDHWQQAQNSTPQALESAPPTPSPALLQQKINRAQTLLKHAKSAEESRP